MSAWHSPGWTAIGGPTFVAGDTPQIQIFGDTSGDTDTLIGPSQNGWLTGPVVSGVTGPGGEFRRPLLPQIARDTWDEANRRLFEGRPSEATELARQALDLALAEKDRLEEEHARLGPRMAESITGTASEDVIFGAGGGDFIRGAGGNDKLFGGDGDDRLTAGGDLDAMWGGDGADTFHIDAGRAWIKDWEGADRIDLSDWGVERMDQLDISANGNGKVMIQAGTREVIVRGREGPLDPEMFTADAFLFRDPSDPSTGPVELTTGQFGGDDADKLYGNNGRDRITDGAGVDNLFGWGGADTFVMVADGEVDSIKDFEDGADRIDISAWGVTGFDQLSLEQWNSRKVILRYEGEVLAVSARPGDLSVTQLDADDFVFLEVA